MSAKVLVYNKQDGFAWVREFAAETPPTGDVWSDDSHGLPDKSYATLVDAVRAARAEGHDVRWWSYSGYWAPLPTESIRS
jgi:hypothetical protein